MMRASSKYSRTALIGEQPNPWDLFQSQDAMTVQPLSLSKIIAEALSNSIQSNIEHATYTVNWIYKRYM